MVGGALLVAAMLVMVVLIPSPHFVNRITFDNPSPYHLDVEVSSGPHEGWMASESGRGVDEGQLARAGT